MKVALITGASGGIGHAIAMSLLEKGYHVSVTGRKLHTLTGAFVSVDPAKVHCIEADATEFTSYSEVVEKTVERFGQLDLLVNSVGGGTLGQTLEKTTLESWNLAMNLNATSVYFTSQAALPYLVATKGTIINFSSILASRPVNGLGPYSASKAAVEMITKSLGLELSSKGIRVVCISPATIQTNFHTAAGMSAETAANYYSASAQTHPIGRVGVPEDISELVCFLADSDKAGFITGSVIHVDGGRMLTSAVATNLQK
jgi:NAD(P)-dependent dehydrogenase (short-subunit alcohol dehydrogenase family)